MKKKFVFSAKELALRVALIAVGVFAITGLAFAVSSAVNNIEHADNVYYSQAQGGGIMGVVETPFTMNTQSGSFTDGADQRQNIQALVERMATTTQYQLLQADSNGIMQPVSLTALAGDWTLPNLTVSGDSIDTNGLTRYPDAVVMTSPSTTPCAFQSPAVTSTLAYASAKFDTTSSTANSTIVTIAKSATAYVTTTAIGTDTTITAGAQATIISSSTMNISVDDTLVFAPSQWLVFGQKDGIVALDSTGGCAVEFVGVE